MLERSREVSEAFGIGRAVTDDWFDLATDLTSATQLAEAGVRWPTADVDRDPGSAHTDALILPVTIAFAIFPGIVVLQLGF